MVAPAAQQCCLKHGVACAVSLRLSVVSCTATWIAFQDGDNPQGQCVASPDLLTDTSGELACTASNLWLRQLRGVPRSYASAQRAQHVTPGRPRHWLGCNAYVRLRRVPRPGSTVLSTAVWGSKSMPRCCYLRLEHARARGHDLQQCTYVYSMTG